MVQILNTCELVQLLCFKWASGDRLQQQDLAQQCQWKGEKPFPVFFVRHRYAAGGVPILHLPNYDEWMNFMKAFIEDLLCECFSSAFQPPFHFQHIQILAHCSKWESYQIQTIGIYPATLLSKVFLQPKEAILPLKLLESFFSLEEGFSFYGV